MRSERFNWTNLTVVRSRRGADERANHAEHKFSVLYCPILSYATDLLVVFSKNKNVFRKFFYSTVQSNSIQ